MMVDNLTFEKTEAGADEVRARSRKLPPRLRTMLIMVDGATPLSQLQNAALTLGAPADFLQALLEQGLIRQREAARAAEMSIDVDLEQVATTLTPPALSAATEGERFRAAQKFMNDSAVDALGFRAFFFTLKLEKCFTTADLRALLPEYQKALAKSSGESAASVLTERAAQLLG